MPNQIRKRLAFTGVAALALVLLCLLRTPSIDVAIETASTTRSSAQLYYDSGHAFVERNSRSTNVFGEGLSKFENLEFRFKARRLYGLRFDAIDTEGTFSIRSVRIRSEGFTLLSLNPREFLPNREVTRAADSSAGLPTWTAPRGAKDPSIILRFRRPLNLRRAAFLPNLLSFLVPAAVFFLLALAIRYAVPYTGQLILRHKTGAALAALCILPWIALLPAFWYGLSQDPIVYMSDLTIQHRAGLLAGNIWLDPNSGFTTQALGGLAASDWLHGRLPWWNPYSGIGMPLAAELQPSALFVPFVLLLHFANGVLFSKLVLEAIAGVCTFLFLRVFGLDGFASFAGGLLFEFAGTFAWFGHAPFMPLAFLPMLLLGVETIKARKSERSVIGGMLAVSAAIAWSLLAGFPETAFLDGLLGLIWLLTRLPDVARGQRVRYLVRISLAGLGGVLLASPAVLPFFEYQSLSALDHIWGLGGLPKASLAIILNPYVFGPIGEFGRFARTHPLQGIWGGIGGYLGCAAVYLAIAGLLGRGRLRLKIALLVWLILILARMVGIHWVGQLLDLIPGMVPVVVVRYGEASCEFATAILAAMAIDEWRRNGYSKRRVAIAAAVFVALLGLSFAFSFDLLSALLHAEPKIWKWFAISLIAGLAFAAGASWLLSRPVSRKASCAMGFLIAAYAMTAYAVPTLSGFRDPLIDLSAVHFLQQRLGLQRFYTLGPIRPNYSAYYEIASVNHDAVPVSEVWVRWIKTHLDSGLDPSIFVGNEPQPSSDRIHQFEKNFRNYETLAVRYVLAPSWTHICEGSQAKVQGFDEPMAELRCVYHDGVMAILELPHPSPYFSFTPGAGCRVSESTRTALLTDCAQDAVLVRRELYYPGWRASVNGHSREVRRDGDLFQSVSVPAGHSKVVFSYVPSRMGWIEASLAIGVAWLLWLAGRYAVLSWKARGGQGLGIRV